LNGAVLIVSYSARRSQHADGNVLAAA